MILRKTFLLGLTTIACLYSSTSLVRAEDCTGTLPAGDCDLDEDTTAPLIINGGVTLTVIEPVTIGHTIDGVADGNGDIVTDDSGIEVIQNAAIGSEATVDNLTIADDDTWTANANISANAINLTATGNVTTFNVNNGATIDGSIDGDAVDLLNIGADLNGGDFTFLGNINTIDVSVDSGNATFSTTIGGTPLADLTIATDSSAILLGSSNTTEELENNGIIRIGAGNRLTVNDYGGGESNNGRYVLGINRDGGSTSAATLAYANDSIDLDNAVFAVNLEAGTESLITETIDSVLIGDAPVTSLPTLEDTSFLYDYALVANGNDADLNITRKSVQAASNSQNNDAYLQRLLVEFSETENVQIQNIQNRLFTASSETQFNEIIESTQATIDNSQNEVSNYVASQTVMLASQRLAMLRDSFSGPTGINTGNGYSEYGAASRRAWFQVFGSVGEQSRRDGIDGFELTTSGFGAGIDTGATEENFILGVGLTYAYTETDSSNANNTGQEITTYQLSLYGTYELDNGYYVNGTLGWGLSDIKARRYNIGGLNNTYAEAEYDTDQYILYSEVGKDIETAGNVTFTPALTVQYNYIHSEDYRERNAGGANLIVNQDPLHVFDIGARMDIEWQYITDNDVYILPEVSFGYAYDIAGDTTETFSTFEAGGSQIKSKGFEPQQHKLHAGVGTTFAKDDLELKLKYNYDFQGDLDIHSGYIRGAYKF